MNSGISIPDNQVIRTDSGQQGSRVDNDLDITPHSNCSKGMQSAEGIN